jgi:hypothetical protein
VNESTASFAATRCDLFNIGAGSPKPAPYMNEVLCYRTQIYAKTTRAARPNGMDEMEVVQNRSRSISSSPRQRLITLRSGTTPRGAYSWSFRA